MFAFLLDWSYWLNLSFYAAIVVVEAWGAWREGWLFEWQVRQREPVPEKFLDLWRHWGIQSDFWVVNPTIAYVVCMHAAHWNGLQVLGAVIFTGLANVPVVKDWTDDPVPSALARKGSVTVPGGLLHYFYMPVTMGPLALYYLFPAYVNKWEVCIVTGILMAHWAIGLLQPPKLVHGKIHWKAWALTGAGWLVLVIAAARLIFFA